MRNPENEIRAYKEGDEDILWTGSPQTGIKVGQIDRVILIFGGIWSVFAVFWELAVIAGLIMSKNPMMIIMVLFGLPFLAIGYFLTYGRLQYDSKMRAHTAYGVTDRRAMIVMGRNKKRVYSFPYEQLTEVTLMENPDGTGTIVFKTAGTGQTAPSNIRDALTGGNSSFRYIEDVKKVYNMIQDLRNKNMPSAGKSISSSGDKVYYAPDV